MSARSTAVHPPAALGWSEAQLGARAFSPGSSPLKMMGGALLAADVAVVVVTACLAHVLRHGLEAISPEVASATLLAAVLMVNVFHLSGSYKKRLIAPASVQIARVLQGWCVVFVSLLILAYLTKTSEQFSRLWVITWGVAAAIGLTAVRVWAAARLVRWRRTGKLARTVAVVDLDGRGVALARRLLQGSAGEMHLVGVFSARLPAVQDGRRSGIEDLLGLARLFRIDEVIVAVSDAEHGDLDATMLKLGTIPTNVRLSPHVPTLAVPPRDASFLFGQPVLTVCSRPLGDWSRVAKRAEDLLISSVAMIFVAPVAALVALAIKIDSPGPVLFRQHRLGFNNNVITVFKFRSMTHRPRDDDVAQARRSDPRVTRVGRFLRRTSLDELPQLLNVLRGDMSLVGPRPHALAHNDQYAALIDGYLGRHRVQPGITGWAQVNGFRGETDTLDKMQRRVEHDLAYTDDWSLALDIKILVMTVFTTLLGRNAY